MEWKSGNQKIEDFNEGGEFSSCFSISMNYLYPGFSVIRALP